MTAQEFFASFAARAAQMSNLALDASIRDCVAAAEACSDHDTEREGKYYDEASVYRAELRARTGVPDWHPSPEDFVTI